MSKINKILLTVVVILIIVLAGVLYWQYSKKYGDDYWAVYLSTGDIYIGKLSYFPRFHLSNVWYFQQTGNQQTPLSLSQFSKVFWGPEDSVYLNEKQIIWKTKLSESSQVLSYIRNPQAGQPQGQQSVQPSSSQPPSENSGAPASPKGQ